MQVITTNGNGQRLRGRDVGVPVRRMGLPYDETLPTYWFGDNAILTAFFAAFSATLPEGERQFIHSVRLFSDKITCPVLAAQVRGFMGQEAHHAKEHRALNNAMRARGFPIDQIESRIRELNTWMRHNLSPAQQLAFTVCAEHITAMMADWALSKQPEILEWVAPEARTIWAWHCIEETEHKAVAFDVYDQLVGDRKLLRRVMVRMSTLFVTFNTRNTLMILRRLDRRIKWRELQTGLRTIAKLVRLSASDYFDFYRADFHPWQHDNRIALAAAKFTYLGEAA